jgi:hypothetical protein
MVTGIDPVDVLGLQWHNGAKLMLPSFKQRTTYSLSKMPTNKLVESLSAELHVRGLMQNG